MRGAAITSDEIDAERGYSEVGAREQRLRDWFATHEPGEKAGDFKRLLDRLYAKKYWKNAPPEYRERILAYRKQWAKENHERYRASVNRNRRRYRADPTNAFHIRELKAKREVWAAARRERLAATVYTCVQCSTQWGPSGLFQLAKGHLPKYCSTRCNSRAGYLAAKARGGDNWTSRNRTGRPVGRPRLERAA